MSRRQQDRDDDALLRGPLAGFVADVEALAVTAPAPTPALAALLEDGFLPDPDLPPHRPPVRPRRSWLVPVPVALLLVGGTVGAASADALPDPAQRVVSDTVATLTRIHLPHPSDRPAPAVRPSPAPAKGSHPVVPVPPTLPAAAQEHRRGHGVPGPAARPTATPGSVGQQHRSDQGRSGEHRRPAPSPLPGHGDDRGRGATDR